MAGVMKTRAKKSLEGSNGKSPAIKSLDIDSSSSDIEIYAKEVLNALIADNLPPTPNNFSLYFDRLLEDKSENLRKQIHSILELEENNDDESTILLEQNLKQGFTSIKSILTVTANLYKNMSLMTKILEKRKKELESTPEVKATLNVIDILEGDVSKLNSILKTQSSQMKTIYDDTAKIVKSVENETIFDNKFGVYNKRYLLTKIEQEIGLIKEFNHKSSLIMIELSRELKKSVNNDKAILLMTRTIARLLLKTSRRSDIVAHYGNGVFAMLLKHTDIESAKKASERLCDLVSNSNFFLADREIQLKISIGVTNIDSEHSVEEIVVSAMDGIQKAYEQKSMNYAVSLRS
ncbi:GGDEF domain-containing protein [Sulfurimonas autotrophica]|uniref:diguanylate cyclase n=1 Tax=Sulfurimonas autotrophica (strain ATCC BAA-671 / DSM 16294 / JCM 11897 / OK10) TaxID=563040 RepID=E0US66_SULAO|nr:GGDEF domain-containing protein [Sulfurimonas autotrophica]ADN10159.1 diguanylate cyclase [Sulfurimonas autotrophica DSM 16294]